LAPALHGVHGAAGSHRRDGEIGRLDQHDPLRGPVRIVGRRSASGSRSAGVNLIKQFTIVADKEAK
jgi:hypothetical protein